MDTNIKRESILANIEYYKKLIQEQGTELSKTKMLSLEEKKLLDNYDWGLED